MGNNLLFFYILVVTGIFASACSQILLKKASSLTPIPSPKGEGGLKFVISIIRSMLNWRVITAYTIFFGSLFINITAMSKGVNLKDLPILESLGYVFVPLLSYIVLKEKISKRTILSIILILIGIFIFYQ